jgi:hypothetical protein
MLLDALTVDAADRGPQMFRLSSLRGTKVLIAAWASW